MKKIFAILMAICLLTSAFCIHASAFTVSSDDVIRVYGLQKDGKTTVLLNGYTKFDEGWEAAVDYAEDHDFMDKNGYDRIAVDLLADWNANDKGEFGESWKFASDWGDGFQYSTIYVPDNTRMMINMNGHTINRGLKQYELDGEVICIGDGADLIINGGKNGDSIARPDMDTGAVFGTITGGYSSNGAGGIHMQDGSKLTLNNVKVEGNKVEDDDGAGIAVYNGASLTVNGGSISDNLLICKGVSYVYGAGIYVQKSTVSLNNVLVQSNNSNGQPEYHPDYYYHCYGAALYADDSTVTVDSCLFQDNGQHLGLFIDTHCVICVYDDSQMTIRQTTFRRNGCGQRRTNGYTSDYYGSMLFYTSDSDLSLESCYFTENSAEAILSVGSGSILNVGETVFKNNYSTVYDYIGSSKDSGSCIFTKCTFQNNAPGANYTHSLHLKTAGNHPSFVDCDLGDASFDDRSKAKFTDTDAENGVGSIFGEGSLTMIIAILALVASAASICLTVVLFKKNAVSATANGAYESDDKE